MKRILVLGCMCFLTACAKPAATPINLSPIGADLSDPATIKGYESSFDKSDKKEIPIGAEIVAVDGSSTKNLGDVTKKYLDAFNKNSPPQEVVLNVNGEPRTVQGDKLYNPQNRHSKIVLFEKNKPYVLTKEVTGQDTSAGALNTDNYSILQTALYWPTYPPMIEIISAYAAKENCKNCSFDDLQVKVSNAKLAFLPLDFAANTIYPDLGPPGQTVAVPPPTVTGYNAFSTTTGSLYGHSYGNNYSGSYSGFTNTTYTPTYDYSAQNAAAFQNLGVAIRNASIQQQNSTRISFFQNRAGNLKVGKMEPGEAMTGSVFYRALGPVNGPIEVTTVLGKRKYVMTYAP